MTRLWRWTGNIMVGIGALHTVVFLVVGRSQVVGMVRDGMVASIGGDEIRLVVWYGGAFLGICMVLLGVAVQHLIGETGRPAPASIGWALVAVGVVGAVVDPVSGAWLVLVCGLFMALPPRAALAE
ncbi:MAG: DUF6463 family protein [Micrococcales bacterium]|nr:DUF6463 family protein [Micrococcales bacterium]MCL2666853.1 DUF6463 family protein [Micrococcales bacterium]